VSALSQKKDRQFEIKLRKCIGQPEIIYKGGYKTEKKGRLSGGEKKSCMKTR